MCLIKITDCIVTFGFSSAPPRPNLRPNLRPIPLPIVAMVTLKTFPDVSRTFGSLCKPCTTFMQPFIYKHVLIACRPAHRRLVQNRLKLTHSLCPSFVALIMVRGGLRAGQGPKVSEQGVSSFCCVTAIPSGLLCTCSV